MRKRSGVSRRDLVNSVLRETRGREMEKIEQTDKQTYRKTIWQSAYLLKAYVTKEDYVWINRRKYEVQSSSSCGQEESVSGNGQ